MDFEELVRQRLAALLRYATVLTLDRALAEDLVQDVLVKAHLHWRQVRRADHPEAYLKRMVLNEFCRGGGDGRRGSVVSPTTSPIRIRPPPLTSVMR